MECKISTAYKRTLRGASHKQMNRGRLRKSFSMLEKKTRIPRQLVAAKDKKTYFIKPEDISLIRAEGRDISVNDRLKNRYGLDKPLYELENTLDAKLSPHFKIGDCQYQPNSSRGSKF